MCKAIDLIKEQYPGTLIMDGFDDCIAGICHRYGRDPIVTYDLEKVIAKHVADGMTHDEAIEYYEFNQIGAWAGDGTPCFLERLER